MEVRKITIVSTTSNSNKVIETSATTLGELKAALDQAGISHDGMVFYEGTSKTQLLDNASPLPKDVPYRGTTTNDLVFMLTNANKKIRSGATSRPELYTKVKELELQDAVKAEFGKNFTQVSSTELEAFVIANTPAPKIKNAKAGQVIATDATLAQAPTTPSALTAVEVRVAQLKKAIIRLVEYLKDDLSFDRDYADEVLEILDENTVAPSNNMQEIPAVVSPYDNSEISDMFKGII